MLFVHATASAQAVATLVCVVYVALLAAAGVAMIAYMFDDTCHGLHYFVGASDWTHSDSSRSKYVWQVRFQLFLHTCVHK